MIPNTVYLAETLKRVYNALDKRFALFRNFERRYLFMRKMGKKNKDSKSAEQKKMAAQLAALKRKNEAKKKK